MNTTFMALLALLILQLAAVWGPAKGQEQTWVSNESVQTIMATISYNGFLPGTSDFVNRVFVPGYYDVDYYAYDKDGVNLEVWVQGSCCQNTITLTSDESVVALDGGDGGVNIFKAVYGTRVQPDGQPLTSIYPETYCSIVCV